MDDLILIVDDSVFARNVAKRTLQDNGYMNIIEAETAKEALQLFTEQKPSLVLLDITLHDNTDLTLLRKMATENPDAKIVMNTAIGQDKIVADALKEGAWDYITKPLDPGKLLDTVTRAFDPDNL